MKRREVEAARDRAIHADVEDDADDDVCAECGNSYYLADGCESVPGDMCWRCKADLYDEDVPALAAECLDLRRRLARALWDLRRNRCYLSLSDEARELRERRNK